MMPTFDGCDDLVRVLGPAEGTLVVVCLGEIPVDGCLNERVHAFLARPIEGDWPYVWLDATIRARQTCFCGLLRSAKTATRRSRSAGETSTMTPVGMHSNRTPNGAGGIPKGFVRQISSTRRLWIGCERTQNTRPSGDASTVIPVRTHRTRMPPRSGSIPTGLERQL